MDWIFTSIKWYFWVFAVGIAFYPLTNFVFKKFRFDSGYPFSKTIGIILTGYIIYVLGLLKIMPFTRLSLISIVIFSGIALSTAVWKKNRNRPIRFGFVFLFEEILFFASFLFWTYIRGHEPSIRSLEKFMDFGFINSILRTNFFPPKDMWYSPLPINYYYFGHLTGAILIKISNIAQEIGYNLILSTIFAQGVVQTFSLVANIIVSYMPKIKKSSLLIFSLLGAYLLNLGSNIHTLYIFTRGYPNENPIPFWKIFSLYSPSTYWYPNATRFIPFTIHEFPSYSYVVADLHGHVFDIPFVLLTVAMLFIFFTNRLTWKNIVVIGFLSAIHYMTNAFDGPIYILFSIFLIFSLEKSFSGFFVKVFMLLGSFWLFALPFSLNFNPFVSGIGLNCSPDFLVKLGSVGPFIFEKNNCQVSPFWMLFVLWGFFWISFLLFLINIFIKRTKKTKINRQDLFLVILFSFGLFLTIIPEFFYIKDIYPQHFRANTMFKLGYQAFMMMTVASTVAFFRIKQESSLKHKLMASLFLFFSFFVMIYPFFSIPSYYGHLKKTPLLNGLAWMKKEYPEDLEIISFINKNIVGQPTILEAQGDSYTDYNRISSFTGLPTVAGWWVHEWLWRGSSDTVGNRIPDIIDIYENFDYEKTKSLIKKYGIEYIIISRLERQKYPNINEEKIKSVAKLIFKSSNGIGALYKVK